MPPCNCIAFSPTNLIALPILALAPETAFLLSGEDRCGALVEYDYTQNIFSNPKMKQTEDYITGRFS